MLLLYQAHTPDLEFFFKLKKQCVAHSTYACLLILAMAFAFPMRDELDSTCWSIFQMKQNLAPSLFLQKTSSGQLKQE